MRTRRINHPLFEVICQFIIRRACSLRNERWIHCLVVYIITSMPIEYYPEGPVDYYDICTLLLRDPNHFVIESVTENATGLRMATASTSRLHNIAGKYVGKDDPVAIAESKRFLLNGEILSPGLAHFTLEITAAAIIMRRSCPSSKTVSFHFDAVNDRFWVAGPRTRRGSPSC